MPMPRVLVLYNEPTLPADHPDADSEHDILYTSDVITKVLQQANLPVTRLGVGEDPSVLLAGLREAAPDVVFNLYEGTAGWGNTEAFVSGLLEMLRLPFTGSPTQPLMLCRSKPLTKCLLAGAGLPTAPFFVIEEGPVPKCPLPWPVIVKPGKEDASVGIDQKSVVTNQQQLEDRVEYIRATYGPSVLVEGFVRGREFNVALMETDSGLTTLPFSEILFVPPADSPDLWPIVSFDAKWRPGTRDFVATPAKNPAEVSPELHDEVARLAKRAFELVGCRDYARVDFRVDESGKPYILEVNPNPCISPLAGLAAGLETAKIPYADFILGVLRSAVRRGSQPHLAERIGNSTGPVPTPIRAEATPARGPAYKIRPARRNDLDTVMGLVTSCEGWSADDQQQLVRRIHNRFHRRDWGGWRCQVLAVNGERVGAVGLRPLEDTPGGYTIDLLVVARSHLRNGYGQALIRAAEEAVAEGNGRFLFAELPSSAPFAGGRHLLTRSGFRPSGEVPDYYRDGSSRLSFVKAIEATVTSVPSEPSSPAPTFG